MSKKVNFSTVSRLGNAAILMTSLLSLSGCLLTRNEVKEVEQRKVMQDQVVNLQKNTADSQVRFNEVYGELREVNGRVEALENRITLVNQEKNRMGTVHDSTHVEMNKKIAAQQEDIQRLEGQVATLTAEMNNVKSAVSSAIAAAAQSTRSEDSESVKADSGTKADPFDLADEQFAKKDWKKAILNFQKSRETNPKSKKRAEATFKIGISFAELGMNDEAKTFLEEVVAKHPKSDFAKKAKAQLKKLK